MTTTSATTTLWIGSALPATHDEAGFSGGTITWNQVTLVSDMGTIGGKTNVVSFTDVSTGKITKRGGAQDFGQMTIKMARHTGADLTALRAAFDDRLPRSFKVVYPAALGETEYFTAVVTGVPTSIGGADTITEMNITLDLDDSIVTVAA